MVYSQNIFFLLRKAFRAVLCSSFDATMSSSPDKTVVTSRISSLSPPVVFKGSLERSCSVLSQLKRMLIVYLLPRWPENASDWILARRTCEISDSRLLVLSESGFPVNVLSRVNVSHSPSLHGTSRRVCLLTCPRCGVPVTTVTAVFTMRTCRMPEAAPEFWFSTDNPGFCSHAAPDLWRKETYYGWHWL